MSHIICNIVDIVSLMLHNDQRIANLDMRSRRQAGQYSARSRNNDFVFVAGGAPRRACERSPIARSRACRRRVRRAFALRRAAAGRGVHDSFATTMEMPPAAEKTACI